MEEIFREVKVKLRLSRSGNINFAPHVHDDVELVYVLKGGGIAGCDGKRYDLSSGDVFVAFPNQIHSYEQCVDGAYIVLIIKPSRLLYLEEVFQTALPAGAVCTGAPELQNLLTDALAEYENNGDSYIVDGYLTAFFGKLFQRLQIRRSPVPNDTVPLILQYCGRHYREAICVGDLCTHLHISRSSVSHIFSDHLKISFSDYINALRLNEAVALLEEPGWNITQISEKAGFPTTRTFNRVFRRQFGISPTEYRKNRRKTE